MRRADHSPLTAGGCGTGTQSWGGGGGARLRRLEAQPPSPPQGKVRSRLS